MGAPAAEDDVLLPEGAGGARPETARGLDRREREAGGRRVERFDVERDQLLRSQAEGVALRVLLGLRTVLERRAVLGAVLRSDLSRERERDLTHDLGRATAVGRLVPDLHAECDARLAREVAGPTGLVAAFEPQLLIDPHRPGLDQVRPRVVIRRGDPEV